MTGRWWIGLALLVVVGCGGSSSGQPQTPAPTLTGTTAIPGLTATATRTASTSPVVQTATPTNTGTVAPTGLPSTPTGTPSDAASPTPTVDDAWTPTPTRTPTTTPVPGESGPIITFVGIVRPDGCRVGCFNTVCACNAPPTPMSDDHGRKIFLAQGGGRGLLVVEARPGSSSLPVGSELVPEEAVLRSDLQIFFSRNLGNGSTAVCDRGPAPPLGMGGGIPAVDPPDFGGDQATTDAINDIACRFAVQPSRDDACTLDNLGNFDFVDSHTTLQFCSQIASVAAFPSGDTLLSVRLRDVAGNLGPMTQIVIRNLAASGADL